MEIIRLVRVDFDNMENHNALSEKEVGIFGPDGKGGSAYESVRQYLLAMPPVALYAGYDGQVYPQFKLQSTLLRGGEQ